MAAKTYETLITVSQLKQVLGNDGICVVDCRFDLTDLAAGRRDYLESHISGAVFADLHDDLSGPPTTDNGRHPLPSPQQLKRLFGSLGIDDSKQVVAYDASGGMFAARLWWMLRNMGHYHVAVLDGGWAHWLAGDGACRSGEEKNLVAVFTGERRIDRLVQISEVEQSLNAPSADERFRLIDARDPKRYRGEVEPIDAYPGHIPAAENHFFQNNLRADGRFKSAQEIQRNYSASLGKLPDETSVHYCGSGVSACHNVLAQVIAGLPEPRLYCGSWSEWSKQHPPDK